MNLSRFTPFRARSAVIWCWLSAIVVVVDQVTKAAVLSEIAFFDTRPVLPFLNLVHVRNTGAAFSMFSDAGGWQRWFLIVLALGVSVGIVIWMTRLQAQRWRIGAALALVLGGAIGNVWDRIQYGYVVDFIDVYYQTWHWPAFNIADSAITLGAVLLCLDLFVGEERPKL